MTERSGESERLFYLAAGPMAALLIGVLLVPLRGLTPASNFTFAFLAVIIVVGELGGAWATLATALVSVLSLDFFLTQPYSSLRMEDKHDIVAFVGLAVSGLIAAGLGSQRRSRLGRLASTSRQGELLVSALRGWNSSLPAEPQLARILQGCTSAFPLTAAVIRDIEGGEIAAAASADGKRPVPIEVLTLDHPGAELAARGGRVALLAGRRPVGWLDVWGTGAHMPPESSRALGDIARLLALLVPGLPGYRRPGG